MVFNLRKNKARENFLGKGLFNFVKQSLILLSPVLFLLFCFISQSDFGMSYFTN